MIGIGDLHVTTSNSSVMKNSDLSIATSSGTGICITISKENGGIIYQTSDPDSIKEKFRKQWLKKALQGEINN